MDPRGSVAVVTGATRGMGRAISGRLAAAGAKVVLVARGEEGLRLIEANIREAGGEAAAFATDVTDRASVEAMVAAVLERYGRVDLLVNCAFWGPPGSLTRTDEAFWDRTLDTTLKGPYLCTRAVYPAMRDQGYSLKYSTGITGASSVIGPIIPPSVAMVIYGWLSDVSVGALFIGGLVPGAMLGLALMAMTVILSYRTPMPQQPPWPQANP